MYTSINWRHWNFRCSDKSDFYGASNKDLYVNGKLFADFWYGEEKLVLPIYFKPDLDTVFNNHGFKIDTRKHKPAQYFKYMTSQYTKVEEMLKSLNEAESNIKLLFAYLEKLP